MGLLTQASVAIDGSKFKAVNNRDKTVTRAKMKRRMAQIEESVARYLEQLDPADRQEPSEALQTKTNRLKEKIETLKQQMRPRASQGGDACHPGMVVRAFLWSWREVHSSYVPERRSRLRPRASPRAP